MKTRGNEKGNTRKSEQREQGGESEEEKDGRKRGKEIVGGKDGGGVEGRRERRGNGEGGRGEQGVGGGLILGGPVMHCLYSLSVFFLRPLSPSLPLRLASCWHFHLLFLLISFLIF